MATRTRTNAPHQFLSEPRLGGVKPGSLEAQEAIDRVGRAIHGKAYRPGAHRASEHQPTFRGVCRDCGAAIRTGQARCRCCNNAYMSDLMRERHAESRAA